jgi:hypothetical protein
LNVKSKRSAWCTKAELNGNVDSENNHSSSINDEVSLPYKKAKPCSSGGSRQVKEELLF